MDKNTDKILLGIVAVVAIVGIIVMVSSSSQRTNGFDSAGQAARIVEAENALANIEDNIPPYHFCTDTDGGIKYYNKGTTYYGNSSDNGTSTDFCRNYNSSVLVEYYCENETNMNIEYQCPYGCDNGACKNKTYPVCGNGIIEPGEECDGGVGALRCVDFGFQGGVLSCYPPGTANSCKFDTSLCTLNQTNTSTCTDSDGGLNYYVGGYTNWINHGMYYDDCINATVLKEYYCVNEASTSTNFYCNYGCFELSGVGRCLKESEINNYTCIDTDGGLNYNLRGTVYGFAGGPNPFNWTDFCSTNGATLTEFYCVGRIPQQTSKSCTCISGACNNNPTNNSGSMYVESRPKGASLFVDGVYSGNTPKTVSGLSVNYHSYNITYPGYYPVTGSKYVYAGNTTIINVTLKPIRSLAPDVTAR